MRRAPTSYKTTPEPPTGHNTVAAVPQRIASCFNRYPLAGGKDKPVVAQEANIVPLELRKTMAQILGDAIALLAMKHRRAMASPSIWAMVFLDRKSTRLNSSH